MSGTEKQNNKNTNRFMLLWYSYPRVAIALSLIAVNLAVILLFTGILTLVTGNSFLDELAYIFTYTMSADGLYDFVQNADDLACFIIKLILAIIQMLIFSGALIGFTTDILQSTIDKRLNNLGVINLSNHYVFLNWSSIGPHLVYDLSFLEGKKNIVILAEEDREDVLNSIQSIFTENGQRMKNIRLFIKNGNPNSQKHLSDVSLDKARYVGILLANIEDTQEHVMTSNDLNALKSLFAIMSIAKTANIVVEAESNDTVNKIESLLDTIDKDLNKRIIVFSHNGVLGHVLGKTLINSTYSRLYHHLLSYEGCEFYAIPTMDIEKALYTYNDCIPIINYDDDDAVDTDGKHNADQLYVLSENSEFLGERQSEEAFIKPLDYKPIENHDSFNVFIFSQAGKAQFVVDELEAYNKLNDTNITCRSYPYTDDLSEVMEEIKRVEGRKKILLLSSGDESCAGQDEDIFLSALSFKLHNCLDENTEVLAEIANPLNLSSLKNFGVMSVIVSNRIISLFMVQLLTHPGSKKFYRDLISTNGANDTDAIDLDIVKVSDVLTFEGETLSFACKSELVQSFYFASDKACMCIGVKRQGEEEIEFLCSAMDKQETIVLSKNDELILATYA